MSILDHGDVVRGIGKVKASLEVSRSQSRRATDNDRVQNEIEEILDLVKETQKRIHKLCYCPTCGNPLTWNRECKTNPCNDN